jgi:protein TonB
MAPAREKAMFTNLIESSSHAREFKRRGSFVLFTTATYLLLFIIAGVASIYAYDASLTEPGSDLELLSYVPLQAEKVVPEPARVRRSNPPAGAAQGPRSTRPVLVDRADNPLNPPKGVSEFASPIPPAHANTVIGQTVMEPSGSGPGRPDGNSSTGLANAVSIRTLDPPPLPSPAPAPKRIIAASTLLNSRALSLPKPPYPPIARSMGVQGIVNVQVLIDETGKVISAKAVSGNPALMRAAQQAAMAARFSPTMLGGQAMKVSGVITYNFMLQ